jgi:(2Fe-2S) ferredoxin
MVEEILSLKPRLHFFICINEREDKSSCNPKITSQDVSDIKSWLRKEGLFDVWATKTKCLGFCNKEGGVLCVYPQGKFFKGLKSKEDIKKIIKDFIGK